MQGQIVNILLIITSIAGIFGSALIFWTNKKSLLNVGLALALLLGSVWGGSIIMTVLTGKTIWGNLSFSSTIMIPVFMILALFYFYDKLANRPRRLLFYWALVALIPFLFAILILFNHFIFVAIQVMPGGYIDTLQYGPLYSAFSILLILELLGTFCFAYLLYRRQTDVIKKTQLVYLMSGLAVWYGFGSLFNMILPAFGINNLNNIGPITTLFSLATMAYVATKHYLFSKKVVFAEIWTAVLILVSVVWLLINLSVFNLLFVLFIISVCIFSIKSAISEEQKRISLVEANERLEKDKKDLQEMDRMKDEFMMMATHELNTPVAVLRGKLSMIFDENFGGFDSNQKEFLKPALIESKRLIRLFKQILDVTKYDQGKAELSLIESDFVQVTKNEIEKNKSDADEKNQNIVLDVPDEEISRVLMDEGKIADVISDLLSNAIKFSLTGKEIKVTITKEPERIGLTVEDHGLGISAEAQKHVFEKFYQAHRFDKNMPQEQQGSGLGLYIAKKIIELHKGEIFFHSVEGQGSTAGFWIPVSQAETDVLKEPEKTPASLQ